MELNIHLIGGKGLADQLYQQLHEAIERGHLAVGTQLPPTRLLAEQVAFARGVHCTAADVLVCNGAQQALDRVRDALHSLS